MSTSLSARHIGLGDVQVQSTHLSYSHLFAEVVALFSLSPCYYNAPPTALTIHMAILTCKPTLRSVFA
jgi:hypothetical protein